MRISGRPWNLLDMHGMALLYVHANPSARLQELAGSLGLSKRQTIRILHDLTSAELLDIRREGRRNQYRVREDAVLLHPLVSGVRLGPMLTMLSESIRVPSPIATAGDDPATMPLAPALASSINPGRHAPRAAEAGQPLR